jgi:hypothetical protein
MIIRLLDLSFFSAAGYLPANEPLDAAVAEGGFTLTLQFSSYYRAPGKSRIVTIWIQTISLMFWGIISCHLNANNLVAIRR